MQSEYSVVTECIVGAHLYICIAIDYFWKNDRNKHIPWNLQFCIHSNVLKRVKKPDPILEPNLFSTTL